MPPNRPDAPDVKSRRDGVSELAIVAFAFGLAGWVPAIGIAFAVVGIVAGIASLAARPTGRRMALAGIVLAAVGGTVANVGYLFGRRGGIPPQVSCASNLNSIGKGIALYMGMYSDQFPRLWTDGNPNAPLNKRPAKEMWAIQGSNAMNNMWGMINEGVVSRSAFHCPSDRGWVENNNRSGEYGWTDLRQFSYGIQWPYDRGGENENPFSLGAFDSLPGEVAVMSDRNPGGSVTSGKIGRRHSNHPDDGGAVLYASFSVQFYQTTTDSLAGSNGDDIYVNSAGVAGGIPLSSEDTSITPVPSR